MVWPQAYKTVEHWDLGRRGSFKEFCLVWKGYANSILTDGSLRCSWLHTVHSEGAGRVKGPHQRSGWICSSCSNEDFHKIFSVIRLGLGSYISPQLQAHVTPGTLEIYKF
ncbi:hypothetical protein RRG08_058616 [Elysia crispata]|uniref:Uncharacterized protein n=1 Tax=Elysia crispata TaxID=231223 RepID=A0AAE1D8S5_9GAST|nr:hypothetical protein RRG08_058616 [Elysia crispata]